MNMLTRMLAGVVVLGLAAGLYAQAPKEGAKDKLPMAMGKVVKVDATAKTLTIKTMKRGEEGTEMTFEITDTTKVAIPGQDKAGSLADVKVDGRVSVLYKAAEGGKNPVALSIRVIPEGSGRGAPKTGG